jgi:hypothetical protein
MQNGPSDEGPFSAPLQGFSGTPGRIRTYGLLLRRQALYPLSYGRVIFPVIPGFFRCFRKDSKLTDRLSQFPLTACLLQRLYRNLSRKVRGTRMLEEVEFHHLLVVLDGTHVLKPAKHRRHGTEPPLLATLDQAEPEKTERRLLNEWGGATLHPTLVCMA